MSAIAGNELAAWLALGADRIPVDLREPEAFAGGHLAGAVNLQHGYAQFELRARRFFAPTVRLCPMASEPELARRTAAAFAGAFPELRWLAAPVETLLSESLPWRQQNTIGPEQARGLVTAGEALLVDARTASEYGSAHAPGAMFVYPDDFPRQVGFLRRDRPIVVICEAGWRSSLLVSWMDRLGFEDARNLVGGMAEWRRLGLPVETGKQQEAFR